MRVRDNMVYKRRKYLKKLILASIISLYFFFLFLFYGPINSFKEFWITSAMITKNHKYLATWIYSEEYIQKVLRNNYVSEINMISNSEDIQFKKYNLNIYRNSYEKQILKRGPNETLYKVISINGHGYHGFLVAIYDASRIHLATTQYLFKKGESILTISEREKAIIAINAGGFFDPDWNSNGAIPHGVVISNGKILSAYKNVNMGGGFIGFTNENKLVLGKISKEEAISIGYRDAIQFGPYLIVNGKRSTIKGNGGYGIAPRTAIGQRKDGIVLFLVINGRIPSSIGADMDDLCDIMENYGAYNAANLDGGSSSELVINGRIINTPVAGGDKGLRDMPTFWVVK